MADQEKEPQHQRPPKVTPTQHGSSSSDEESPALWAPPSPDKSTNHDPHPRGCHRRRRRLVVVLGGLAAGTVLIAVILVILAFTLYKVCEPQMTVQSITIVRRDGTQGGNALVDLFGNSTVKIVAMVRNPNRVTYYYDRSTTSIYYDGSLLTEAPGPTGKAKPRRTLRLTVMVKVSNFHINDTMIAKALTQSVADVDASTMVDGHVKLFGLVKHRVDVLLNCTVALAVANFSIMGQTCHQHVWA